MSCLYTIPVLSCAFQNYEISETVTRFYQNISQTQKEAEPSQSSETELAVSNRIPECDVFAV
jgi:cell division protein FtsL